MKTPDASSSRAQKLKLLKDIVSGRVNLKELSPIDITKLPIWYLDDKSAVCYETGEEMSIEEFERIYPSEEPGILFE